MRRTISIAAIALASVAFGGCDNSIVAPISVENTAFATSLGVNLAASTKTPSGLYYRDIITGAGLSATVGTQVSVYYTGYLSNGQIFDSRVVGQSKFQFLVGVGSVIAGWDEGVQGMKVGGRRQLIIPPSLGYGTGGSGDGKVPGNAVIVFTIDLSSIP